METDATVLIFLNRIATALERQNELLEKIEDQMEWSEIGLSKAIEEAGLKIAHVIDYWEEKK